MMDSAVAEQRLEEWRESLHPVVERLAFFVPADFSFDYSAESLDLLEGVVLERFPPGLMPAPDGGFLESVAGCLGEALLRVGGGGWEWDTDPGSATFDQPVIRPDAALDRPALAPLWLVAQAARSRTGREFSGEHAALGAAVAKYRKTHPSWSPAKEHTPGLDETDAPPHEWLSRWLAERAAAFPSWVASFGGDPAAWDFSVGTYDLLEDVVLRRLSAVEDVTDPAHHDFVQGAIWYLGELPRHSRADVEWQYNPAVPESTNYAQSPSNPWVGRPYVTQRPDGDSAIPVAGLKHLVRTRERGYLRQRFAPFL